MSTTSSDGTVIAIPREKQPEKYSIYTVRSNDTIDSLAISVYGDPSLYWRIADINPHIQYPDSLQVGDVIRIPE